MSTTTATMTPTRIVPHLQPLSPVVMTPTRSSKASEPLSFLAKIDRVEINHTTERDGVVYYAVDVFLEHSTSRIPTLKSAKAASTTGRPDFQLERRFNDFADLRHQVWTYAQRKHEEGCTCKYCDAFMNYIVHSMSQPRLFVKLATSVDMRKKLMTTFCNEFIAITLGSKSEPRQHNLECDTRKKLMTTFCNEFIAITLGSKSEPRPHNLECDGMESLREVVSQCIATKWRPGPKSKQI